MVHSPLSCSSEEEQCLVAISLFTLTFASQHVKQASFISFGAGGRALPIYADLQFAVQLKVTGLLILLALSRLVCPCRTSTTTHGTMALGPLSFPRSFLSETGTHTAKSGLRFAAFENSELFILFLAEIAALHRHTQFLQGTEPRA